MLVVITLLRKRTGSLTQEHINTLGASELHSVVLFALLVVRVARARCVCVGMGGEAVVMS